MGEQLPRRGGNVNAMAHAVAQLDEVTRGREWRRLTPIEVADAIDEVLRAWRATHR